MMRKLTSAEAALLSALDCVHGGAIPVSRLQAQVRAMAKRMRIKGYLRKREFSRGLAKATKFGEMHLRTYRKAMAPATRECGLCGGPLPCLTHSQGLSVSSHNRGGEA